MSYLAGQLVTAAELNQIGLIPVVPTATASNGTATSATTDTLDIVLGVYQFTAIAGTRYMVFLNNYMGNGSVIGDVFAVTVRDSGSAATPTTSSTAVAQSGWACTQTGGPGRVGCQVQGSLLVAATGTHTLGVFTQRTSGTGVGTPIAGTGSGNPSRELFVMAVALI